MGKPRILIVEDDEHLLNFYTEVLEQADYTIDQAQTGRGALDLWRTCGPDLVILDLTLAGHMDGLEVLVTMRQRAATPVMVLTGEASEARLVRALNLGADNYVCKPVTRAELLARVRAHLRRGVERAGPALPGTMDFGRLVIDFAQNQLKRDDGQRFTVKGLEKLILTRLLQTPGELVTYRELMRLGWPQSSPRVCAEDSRALMSCVYRLRRKLDLGDDSPLVIETVLDEGLRISVCEVPPSLEGAKSK
jgi:DNA-binding response OmpR family regulator